MASIIQCLSNTPELRSVLRGGRNPRLASSFEELLGKLHTAASGTSVNPAAFKREVARFAPRFSGYQQQDAQEFLRFLLDGLHDDLNVNRGAKPPPLDDKDDLVLPDAEKARLAWEHYKARNSSPVIDLFGGQLVSRVTCGACGYASATFDPFLDLSLPIPKGTGCTLKECLEEFTASEVLDDLYRCSKCKKRTRASKAMDVYRLPTILVVHLKRFSSNSGFHASRSKITTDVSFPLDSLHLGGATYSLHAVSCHSGSLTGGHYTATCRGAGSTQWYDYNDSRVSPCSSSSVRGP
jgi:ubiquitin carboxyl-terminal hydrolase 2/21